jgi:hypothetical protein
MKVALCLSGQLRTAGKCFPSIKTHILDVYQPEVYIATDPNLNYHSSIGPGKNDVSFEEIKELYKPIVAIKVNDDWPEFKLIDKNFLNSRRVDSCNVDRFISDLAKRYGVGVICKNQAEFENSNYDIIIRARFDIQINEILPIIPNSGITIPAGQDWLGGLNDQLAWGDPQSMFWYLSLLRHIETYTKEGILVHPETMLKHHLDVKTIPVHRVPLNYAIMRV